MYKIYQLFKTPYYHFLLVAKDEKAKLHFLNYLIFIVFDQIKVHTLVMMIQVFYIIPYCLPGNSSHAQAQNDELEYSRYSY